MFYLYVIYSESADLCKAGYTSNVETHLHQHNNQQYFNTFTAKYRPWTVAALFQCEENENEAIQLERFIKKQHSRKLIEKLRDPSFRPTGILAKLVRFPHVRD